MKKVILALLVVIMAMAPVMADENWVGVDLGVPIGITSVHDSTLTLTNLEGTVRGTFYFDRAETIGVGASIGFGGLLNATIEGQSEKLFDNFVLAPAVTFQYRLELNDDMDLRFGLGMAYEHMFVTDEAMPSNVSLSYGSVQIAAEASFVYSFDQIGIVAGVDIGVPVYTYTAASGGSESATLKMDQYGVVIAPRVGVSYAF